MPNQSANTSYCSRYSTYTFVGILLLFWVNMLYAIKDVIAANLLSENNSVMTIMFIVFLIAVLSFTAVDSYQNGLPGKANTHGTSFKDILLLNIATAGSWWGYFYSLKFIEPAVAGAFIGGLVIIVAWALNMVFRKEAPSSGNDLWTTFAIFLLGAILMYLSLEGKSAIGDGLTKADILRGFFGASVCAIGISATTIHLKCLFERGANSAHLLSRRFYLVVLISGAVSYSQGDLFKISLSDLVIAASISIFCIVLALYALQEGIRRCEPVLVEAIHAALPLLTLFFQLFDPRLQISTSSWICVSLISLIVMQSCYHHVWRG